jgi:phosphoribosylaminoimidazole-succinocarboxamide synthase
VNAAPTLETHVANYPLYRRGKVRESYDLGGELLIIATDRISAFDVIMPNGIPHKGAILTQLSAFWFERTAELVPNHLLSTDLSSLPGLSDEERGKYSGRSMIVRKAERINIECVVRGHVSGSAWAEYRQTEAIAGEAQPSGLVESQRLMEPLFTPAIKNDQGHDENISRAELAQRVGSELSTRLESASRLLYEHAYAYAMDRGIIIADTKFEFGFADDRLIVIDEMLTPDSSRFWDAASYTPGRSQESFDKQYLRDWLLQSGWNREPPAPMLPPEVVAGTASRYREAFERMTGSSFDANTDDHRREPVERTIRA